MPRPMSEDVSSVIVQALSRGLSRGQISGVVGVSSRTVTRINANLRMHGTPKGPPSGVKAGRPAKLSNAQSQAMLVWMAERGHKFYVKDLVQYLREEHGYHGCDANVRRGLVKGGFKRKLPWHKSEVTTWIPPDHAAVFVTNVEGDGEGGKSRLPKEVNPALDELPEDFNNSERQTPLPVAGDGAVYAVAIEGQAPAGLDEAMSLDARSELIDPLLDHPQANITPITNPTNHALTVANTPSPVPLPETTDHLGLTDPANLASQVLTLQEENARQQDLILALQQQLAESQARVTGDTASQGYSLKSIRLGPRLKEVSRYSSPYAVMPGSGEA